MSVGARLTRAAPFLLIASGAAYFYHLSGSFDYFEIKGQIGPNAWPRLILGLLMAACACQALRALAFGRVTADEGAPVPFAASGEAEAPVAPPQSAARRASVAFAGSIVYLLVFEWIGFFLATVTYLTFFIMVGGYRSLRGAIVAAVVGTLALMFMFVRVIYVSLPLGVPPFAELSILLIKLLGVG
jgi:putative tricarboxylic transport membrane protein